jgi:hypothetical protein
VATTNSTLSFGNIEAKSGPTPAEFDPNEATSRKLAEGGENSNPNPGMIKALLKSQW